jgi:hypothetical protein
MRQGLTIRVLFAQPVDDGGAEFYGRITQLLRLASPNATGGVH